MATSGKTRLIDPSQMKMLVTAGRISRIDLDSSEMENEKADEGYILVAAIDFGTTYSGYAFSFKSDLNDIKMNKNWGSPAGFESYKTPTCVLTGPDGNFDSFGYEAERKYSEQVENNSKERYHLYRHFKLILHKQKNITRDTMIHAENGQKRPAMDIFVMAIAYLMNHMLKAIDVSVERSPNVDMIRWVLTVPAIWSDGAKQFMREAACKAGLIKTVTSPQLVIALEPEAASLFCRRIEIGEYIMRGQLTELPFKPKTKYLVIDAGGGTIDITAHEVLVTRQIRELHIANGGAWGGILVDEQFTIMLEEIFGKEFINMFKNTMALQWLTSVAGAFERSKKSVNPKESETRVVISIPWSFANSLRDFNGKDVQIEINKFREKGIKFENGSLVCNNAASLRFFDNAMKSIQQHVTQLLKSRQLHDISYVVIVGGFGESKVLQHGLKEIMPENITVIVPPEAQLAVIKGAVHFGHHRKEIKSRVSKKTYGIDTMHHFTEGRHDPKKKIVLANDRAWCDDVFECFVKRGDEVDVSKVIKKKKKPTVLGQQVMDIDIWCTDKADLNEVEYITAPYMERLGGIHVQMPLNKDVKDEMQREVEISFLFGDTEIQVTAKDTTTGKTAETVIDFITS